MSCNCKCQSNYSVKKIHKSGLKCFPYTWTLAGVYTQSGIWLEGEESTVGVGAEQAPVVAVPNSSCCGQY